MAELVRSLPEEVQTVISSREWKVSTVEGIRKKKELGLAVIPAIALDGEPFCQSTIPPQADLIEAIWRRFGAGRA